MKRIWNLPLKYKEWKGMKLTVDLDSVHCPHCKEAISFNSKHQRFWGIPTMIFSLSILLPRLFEGSFIDNNYFRIGCLIVGVLMIFKGLMINEYERKKT